MVVNAAIAARGAVDLHHAGLLVIRNFGEGDCAGAAGNLQHVSDPCADAVQVVARETCNGVADVLDTSFRYPQCDRRTI